MLVAIFVSGISGSYVNDDPGRWPGISVAGDWGLSGSPAGADSPDFSAGDVSRPTNQQSS